ncbi:MAG: hypothetical protein KJ731_17115 [Alphaproteobacteria bacterium]|nr:hypothetical protein [Alphaproteobacteria bacterium]MBU1280730.1 hypothetical protein [Alphaproteobacteria bacterium]MBU1573886.1 hypothetical protein [Alphaproteobacteria bacterium]MBU1830168.1 hypothetical protein [Alphaproteobacteria bacterium]MBU2078109.1 hypothetical protein [Alphaproteobacteria bacterium]
MKKLLATTAVALIAMSGAASAQSVLERVLTSLDAATSTELNGTFANIAENLGGGTTTAYMDANGDIISEGQYDILLNAALDSIDAVAGTGTIIGYQYGSDTYSTMAEAVTAAENDIADNYTSFQTQGGGIDGSITNVIEGVTSAIADATQSSTAGTTIAYEFNLPTYDLGALSTTALGAVNTGDITLGVNSTVDDAKTTSTQAVSSVMQQLGGTVDNGALVLNIASNMTAVDGSISNTMNNVNGVLASASTTALGAVNTGTITSGVNAAVQGIVGTSGSTTN